MEPPHHLTYRTSVTRTHNNLYQHLTDRDRLAEAESVCGELLAPFEKTVRYHGQIAQRAAKTRRRNAQAAAEQAETPQPAPEPAPQPA